MRRTLLAFRPPVVAVIMTAAAVWAHVAGFDGGLVRSRVCEGELWRLVTAHFVHFGWGHFVGDVVAFAVWAALIEAHSRRLLIVSAGVTIAAASSWIVVACPEVTEYRGISALDAALAVQLFLTGMATAAARRNRLEAMFFVLCLAAFVSKTSYELAVGHAIFASDLGSRARLLPSAHVIGVVAGIACWSAAYVSGGLIGAARPLHSPRGGRALMEAPPADSDRLRSSRGEARIPFSDRLWCGFQLH